MQAFLDLYPLIVLAFGVVDAAGVMAAGLFVAARIAFGGDADDTALRMMQVVMVFVVANVIALMILSWTRWMLAP